MTSKLPQYLYTCEQTRLLDQAAIEQTNISGIVLMKNAARAALSVLIDTWGQSRRIVVFCGSGNNGGDGYLLAGLAAQKKIPVSVFSLATPSSLSGDVQKAYYFAIGEGAEVLPVQNISADTLDDAIVVDAMIGSGFHGELRDNVRQTCALIRRTNSPVLALDIPTGVNGDTGVACEGAIKADVTVTFVAVKQGLLTASGPEYCGKLFFDNLAIPDHIYQHVDRPVERISQITKLMPRSADSHKGDYGRVLVVGGDLGMGGAALLAAESAMRAGAGGVMLATRPEHVAAALVRTPEVMSVGINSGPELEDYTAKADVLIVGPGLGQSAWSQQLLYFALKAQVAKIIDADALNLIAQRFVSCDQDTTTTEEAWDKNSYHKIGFVMTPHPGEAARLLGCSTAEIANDRFAAVTALHKKYGGISVLKGAGTLIADEQGSTLTNVGNPGMAVAGMGDVLTGIIAALVAQGMTLKEAAVAGVCIHGHAGDCASQDGQVGILASDLMPFIRQLVNRGIESN